MKKIFVAAVLVSIAFIIYFIIYGFQKKEENISETKNKSEEIASDHYQFRFKEISEEDYNKISSQNLDEKLYHEEYMDQNFVLEETESAFIFPLSNGKTKEFSKKRNTIKSYSFLGKYKELPFYIVRSSSYMRNGSLEIDNKSIELYHSFIYLIHQKTGKEIELWDGYSLPFILQNKDGFLFITGEHSDYKVGLEIIRYNEKKKIVSESYPLGYYEGGFNNVKVKNKVTDNKLFLKYGGVNIAPIFIELSWKIAKEKSVYLLILNSEFLKETIFNDCILFGVTEGSVPRINNACTASKTEQIIEKYGMTGFEEEISLLKKRIQIMEVALEKDFSTYDSKKIKDLEDFGLFFGEEAYHIEENLKDTNIYTNTYDNIENE